ncbi:MAG: hypothetical protein R3B99_24975 [Polyangiales bacterium]
MTTTPERPEPASRRRAGRIGRRVALAIYWSFMLYVAVVSFYSLIPQIFWPKSHDTLEETGTCEMELTSLVERLRAHVAATVGGEAPEEEFFRRWDDRYVALRPRCEDDDRYARVGTLRHRIDTTEKRFAREDGRLFEEVERSLRPAARTRPTDAASGAPREGS